MSEFEFPENDENAHSFADGGVTNYANVEYILLNQPDELTHIDVIFHNTRKVVTEGYDNSAGLLKRLLRVMDMFNGEIFKNDLINAKLRVRPARDIGLNIYYMNELDITTITTENKTVCYSINNVCRPG